MYGRSEGPEWLFLGRPFRMSRSIAYKSTSISEILALIFRSILQFSSSPLYLIQFSDTMMSGSTAFGAAVSGPDQAPKKHRRPALSCVQCRRRKVKCDRNIPCNRCTQSKNTVCQYDPEGPARARAIHSVASTASPSTSIDNFSISQEPVLKGTLSLSNSVTPNSKPQVMSWVSGSRAVSDQDNVQHLQDRIRQLESALSTMTYKDKTPKDTVPLDGNRNPILRGSAEDTQFFGMGHWMMFKKEVSNPNPNEESVIIV